MNHVYDITSAQPDRASVVTIGVFDGVHRGHQALIGQLVERAHQTDRRAVALTLFPHPDIVLRGQSGRFYLTTPEQKAALLSDLGVDLVITYPFNDAVRTMRATVFVDLLVTHLAMQELWVTRDFALGYKREGNFTLLQTEGAAKGFAVRAIDLLGGDEHAVISSTRIRDALADGRVDAAADLLGRPYAVQGQVIHGDHRGRTIGFPTANVDVWAEQIIPANGVYACYALFDGERHMAVTNIGQRPTFNGIGTRVEAHLLDFDRDIYGRELTLEFFARLRGEQKFNGIDALVAQIGIDAAQGRAILSAAG